jgi:uncharacterized membrane protein YdjX (TVP38/TMEM64 family)
MVCQETRKLFMRMILCAQSPACHIQRHERGQMSLSISREKLQTIFILLVAFGFSLAGVVYTSNNPGMVEHFVRATGLLGPVAVVGLYSLLGVSPIPSEALSLITGAIYGPLLGTVLGFTGNMMAAIIEYYIGMRIGGIADFEERRKRLPFGMGRFPADSAWFLIFGRLLPGYGGKLVSVVGGVYRVPMSKYVWTAAIPTLIGSAIFVAGGWGLLNGF